MPCVIVATTPRTGSSYLSNLLQNTLCVGATQEYALREDFSHWRDFHGYRTHREYFENVRQLHSWSNGSISFKLMCWQLEAMIGDIREYLSIDGNGLSVLERFLGPIRFIYLRRQCPLSQTVSLARAVSSGIWAIDAEQEAFIQPSHEEYDPIAIYSAAKELWLQDKVWREFFGTFDIFPFTICYEHLIQDPDQTLRNVLRWLELEPRLPLHTSSKFVKQAGVYSEKLRDRFIDEELGVQWMQTTWAGAVDLIA